MKHIVRSLLFVLVVAFALAPASAAAPNAEVVHPTDARVSSETHARLDALLYDYDVVEVDTRGIQGTTLRDNTLAIHLLNQTFQLELELNDLRAPDYRAVLMVDGEEIEQNPGPVTTYRGSVAGHPGGYTRLTINPNEFSGYIRTEHDWIFVDPLNQYVDGAPSHLAVIYRDGDVRPEAGGLCGSDHLRQVAEPFAPPANGPAPLTEMPRRLQVATDFDGQYYQRYGQGSFSRIQSILNSVDGIYRADLNLFISITYQQGWSSVSGDPYTSLSANTTLTQFRNWWNANRGGTVRDTAHQFSGKNFSGSTVGIAWVGVVCNVPSLSYGVSQDQSSSFLNTQLTGHEIGHNLSAGHDNQSPVCSGVSCNGSGPVMCSFLQSSGSNRFSSCSRSSVANHVASFGSCL